MSKQEMIEFLMEELCSTMGDDNIYTVAEHFYRMWLDAQDAEDVLAIYSGEKNYWEIK